MLAARRLPHQQAEGARRVFRPTHGVWQLALRERHLEEGQPSGGQVSLGCGEVTFGPDGGVSARHKLTQSETSSIASL
jgi:hypothetical protein